MRKQRERRKAFTLVEILLVLGIIAAIAAVMIPNLLTAREGAKIDQTHIQIEKAMAALERYAIKLDYPTSDQGLKALVEKPTFDKPEMDKNWRGPYLNLSDLNDAWDTPMTYKLDDVTDSAGTTRKVPRIYSFGPNKTDDNGDGDDIKNKSWADESASTSGH
jgi:general secretion pathway protein G